MQEPPSGWPTVSDRVHFTDDGVTVGKRSFRWAEVESFDDDTDEDDRYRFFLIAADGRSHRLPGFDTFDRLSATARREHLDEINRLLAADGPRRHLTLPVTITETPRVKALILAGAAACIVLAVGGYWASLGDDVAESGALVFLMRLASLLMLAVAAYAVGAAVSKAVVTEDELILTSLLGVRRYRLDELSSFHTHTGSFTRRFHTRAGRRFIRLPGSDPRNLHPLLNQWLATRRASREGS